MPQGNSFWNPYRWVPIGREPVRRATPLYHHRLSGLAGRMECRLTALTPLLINDGNHKFVRSRRTQKPYLPATSLKGLIRSLVELIGNAAQPFPRSDIDPGHELGQAAAEVRGQLELDIAARLFGFLRSNKVFAGLVRFSDGDWQEGQPVPSPLACRICVGAPKVEHRPFYPDKNRRKFYHHQPGTGGMTGPHAGIPADRVRTVSPLPPGVAFSFSVDFTNLREEDLNLLLYCLFLPEQPTVTLSPDIQSVRLYTRGDVKGCQDRLFRQEATWPLCRLSRPTSAKPISGKPPWGTCAGCDA